VSDNLSPPQRSYAMSRIRSSGNKTTEQALIVLMRAGSVRGWRRNSVLPGRPDFIFPKTHVAVFVDGW
jgi:DNA mismatch endonuclease (patch repair protein)